MVKYKDKIKNGQLIVQVKLSSQEEINERELDFISNKYIRGLFKVRKVKKLWSTSLECTGPAARSLFEYLKGPISKQEFFLIIEQVLDMTRQLKENSMPSNRIVWDIHKVYINDMTKELQFLYLPLNQVTTEIEVLNFFDQLIYSIHPFQGENTEYIINFSRFLKEFHNFDTQRIEEYVRQQGALPMGQTEQMAFQPSEFVTQNQGGNYQGYSPQAYQPYPNQSYQGYEDDEADTQLLEEEEATQLLEDEDETQLLEDEMETDILEEVEYHALLFRVATEENILIDRLVFRVGREPSLANYIVNNNAIGRSHIDIITRNDRYFIRDLHSVNKTYVNGQMIPPDEEIELQNGDNIRLANEDFVFIDQEKWER